MRQERNTSLSARLVVGAAGLASTLMPFATSFDSIFLTVQFCPTTFTSAGAVVKIDNGTQLTLQHKFKLHDGGVGCELNEDSVFTTDPRSRTAAQPFGGRSTHLSYTGGKLVVASNDAVKTDPFHTTGTSDDDFAFMGWTSFAVSQASSGKKHVGLTEYVTQDGFCDHGCFRHGHVDLESGVFHGFGPLPFKAASTGTRFHHEASSTYYVQGDYPLAPEGYCGNSTTSNCLYAINTTTGALISAKETPDFIAYKYEDALEGVGADGSVLAWGRITPGRCDQEGPEWPFAFVRQTLATGKVEVQSCSITHVHFNPAMSAFSHDNKVFVTASGDIYGMPSQMLVIDVASGKLTSNSELKDIYDLIGTDPTMRLMQVWGVAQLPAAA